MDNSTTITTVNLTRVCRVCLMEYEEMHSLFSEIQIDDNLEDEPIYLCEIIMSISSIRVRNYFQVILQLALKISAEDLLPTMVCSSCAELAHTSYKFQQQCNRSQEILDTYVAQLQDKEFPYEEDKPLDKENSDEVLQYLQTNLTSDENEENKEEEEEQTPANKGEAKLDSIIMVKDEMLESTLNAVKIAALEDSVRLRQRLELKRIDSDKGQKSVDNLSQFYIKIEESEKIEENESKSFKCDRCGKSYKHANSLKIHQRTHTLERPYLCSHCGKGFKQYGALSYHLRSHTGEQPYACKICGKRYRQSGTLTAHMRVHTGQKPFLCSVCGRGFRQSPDLGYHMRTHTKERPYMCSVCGKTMRMQCHLVQHMRIHTGERPFKCTQCDKAFPSSTRLKRHSIIHTGLKPYTCEVCSKSFNRLSSLRVHAKIHTDERPHVCSVCGKGFIQAHALRGHMNTHSSADDVDKIDKTIFPYKIT